MDWFEVVKAEGKQDAKALDNAGGKQTGLSGRGVKSFSMVEAEGKFQDVLWSVRQQCGEIENSHYLFFGGYRNDQRDFGKSIK